jgi:hypothetical protein
VEAAICLRSRKRTTVRRSGLSILVHRSGCRHQVLQPARTGPKDISIICPPFTSHPAGVGSAVRAAAAGRGFRHRGAASPPAARARTGQHPAGLGKGGGLTRTSAADGRCGLAWVGFVSRTLCYMRGNLLDTPVDCPGWLDQRPRFSCQASPLLNDLRRRRSVYQKIHSALLAEQVRPRRIRYPHQIRSSTGP